MKTNKCVSIYDCYRLKAGKTYFGMELQILLSLKALLVTILVKCAPSYPDSHVLNQSSVVIVTADDVGPAAPVSLCVRSRPSVNT